MHRHNFFEIIRIVFLLCTSCVLRTRELVPIDNVDVLKLCEKVTHSPDLAERSDSALKVSLFEKEFRRHNRTRFHAMEEYIKILGTPNGILANTPNYILGQDSLGFIDMTFYTNAIGGVEDIIVGYNIP